MPHDYEKILELLPRITPQWLAGFFDGEGHVSIMKDSKSGNLSIQLGITQNDEYLLALIMLKYRAGNIYSHYNGNKNGRMIDCFVYRINGKEIKQLLEDILPYSVVKRERIEVALRFLVSPSEELREKMLELNCQGKSPARIAAWKIKSGREN